MKYIFYFFFSVGFVQSTYSQTGYISADSTKQLLESQSWVVFTNKDDYKTNDTLTLNSNISCFTAVDQLNFKGYIDIKFKSKNKIEFTESWYIGESIMTRSYIDESNVYKCKVRENRNGEVVLSIKNKFYGKIEYLVVPIEIKSCEFHGTSPNTIIELNLTKPKLD
jgi:hypothetical protein